MKQITLYYILLFCFFLSCKKNEDNTSYTSSISINTDDSEFVKDSTFAKGDARRYGVFPNLKANPKDVSNILNLAEKGILIKFQKGFYDMSLIFEGRNGVSMHFDDSEFSGQIQIIEDIKGIASENIKLKGKLTTYNKLFTRQSINISIDTLIIASDTLKNSFGERSLGCNIYAGTKHLDIKHLNIKDLGSGSAYYTHSLAALQIHGWNDNPEYITIREAVIEKSDRHGAYITGNNHQIDQLTIKKVGLGTVSFNNGLEDAELDEINTFTALWINKCQNTTIDKAIIDCKDSKAAYTVHFDEGLANEPTIINYLTINNKKNSIPMLPRDLTNIVVRHFKERNEYH